MTFRVTWCYTNFQKRKFCFLQKSKFKLHELSKKGNFSAYHLIPARIKWFIELISQLDQLDQSVLSVPLVSSVPSAPLVPSACCHWPHRSHRSHRSHRLHRPAATQVKPNCNLNFSSRTGPIDFKVWSQTESVLSVQFGLLRSDLNLTTLVMQTIGEATYLWNDIA